MSGNVVKRNMGYSMAGLLLAAASLAGCPPVLTVDYHTQVITPGANNLQGKSLYFMPDSSINFYSRTVIDGISDFNVDPSTGTLIDFSVADPFELTLPGGMEVLYYGRAYDTLFIASDGSIDLGDEGPGNSSVANHFTVPQVSLLPVDASAGNGQVRYEIFTDEIVITYANVIVGNTTNSFQAEFYITGTEDGDLALTYPVASINVGGVVGLSNGQLQGANQAQIDSFLAGFAQSNLTTNNTGTAKLGE